MHPRNAILDDMELACHASIASFEAEKAARVAREQSRHDSDDSLSESLMDDSDEDLANADEGGPGGSVGRPAAVPSADGRNTIDISSDEE